MAQVGIACELLLFLMFPNPPQVCLNKLVLIFDQILPFYIPTFYVPSLLLGIHAYQILQMEY